MNLKIYLSLIFFCISTSITPGPNNIMIMLSGLNYGIKKSLPHYYGICFGFCLLLVVVGLGFNTIFAFYPMLSISIKTVGLAYLIYLAVKIIFSSTQIKHNINHSPLSFMQAVLFQWVNPKTWMMATGVFAAFNLPDANIYQHTSLITLIFGLTASPCIAMWMLGGVMLNSLLSNDKYLRRFNYIMGFLLILSILLMLI